MITLIIRQVLQAQHCLLILLMFLYFFISLFQYPNTYGFWHSGDWSVAPTVTKFGGEVHLSVIWVDLEGQGHRYFKFWSRLFASFLLNMQLMCTCRRQHLLPNVWRTSYILVVGTHRATAIWLISILPNFGNFHYFACFSYFACIFFFFLFFVFFFFVFFVFLPNTNN